MSIEIKKKEPFFTIKILEGFRTEFSEPALVLYNEIKQALISEFGEDKLVEDS